MPTITVRYIGPHREGIESVEFDEPVPYDVPIDASEDVAKRLLQQPDNWAVDQPAAKKGNS